MEKIKKLFKFITSKEFLIKVILIQIVILLFTIMSGNFQIKVYNRGYVNIGGKLGIDNGDDYMFKIEKL